MSDGNLPIMTKVSKQMPLSNRKKNCYYQSNRTCWGYYFAIRYLSPDGVVGTGTAPNHTASEIADLLSDAQGVERIG